MNVVNESNFSALKEYNISSLIFVPPEGKGTCEASILLVLTALLCFAQEDISLNIRLNTIS